MVEQFVWNAMTGETAAGPFTGRTSSQVQTLLVVNIGYALDFSCIYCCMLQVNQGNWKPGPGARSGGSVSLSLDLAHFRLLPPESIPVKLKDSFLDHQYQFICLIVEPRESNHGYTSATSFIRRTPRLARVTPALHELTPGRHRG
jgi:hypothetical protein